MFYLVDKGNAAGFAGVGFVSLRHRATAVVEVTFVVCRGRLRYTRRTDVLYSASACVVIVPRGESCDVWV